MKRDASPSIDYEALVRDPELVEYLHRRASRLRSLEGAQALIQALRAWSEPEAPPRKP